MISLQSSVDGPGTENQAEIIFKMAQEALRREAEIERLRAALTELQSKSVSATAEHLRAMGWTLIEPEDYGEGTVQHVSWGPEAASLTEAERAAIVRQVLDDAKKQNANRVGIPVSQLTAISDALGSLVRLGQLSVQEWASLPKSERDLRLKVGLLAEMPHCLAEQWLPKEVQKARRARKAA